MSILSHPLTYADLERAREASNDRLELIEGEIYVSPSPSPKHQLILHRLDVLLDRAVVETELGIVMSAPLDTFLDDQNVFQPDLIILLQERSQLFGSTKIEGPPSLAIEIISPSTGIRDRRTKRDLYARFGVPEYWIVDPSAQEITIYSSPHHGRYEVERVASDVAASATIPGLSINLAALFAPPFAG
jgi:Uma2 family endonuclease